jgi:D-alanine-D-alanine ligase
MDKILTKQLLLFHGLPTPGYSVVQASEDVQAYLAEAHQFPLVVKPAHEGSTLGISIARNPDELRAGIEAAAEFDAELLVEEFIDGPELTVAVMDGVALPIIQIEPQTGFYDYRAKYTAGQTRYLLPAPLDAQIYAAVQQAAVRACRVIGCRGAARVDFMLCDNSFYCLEVNTIPGMTETSLLPKAAAAVGLNFGQMAEQILLDAALDK